MVSGRTGHAEETSRGGGQESSRWNSQPANRRAPDGPQPRTTNQPTNQRAFDGAAIQNSQPANRFGLEPSQPRKTLTMTKTTTKVPTFADRVAESRANLAVAEEILANRKSRTAEAKQSQSK